ncbi:MAG TPA: PPC domain-containing protein, partial [Myxococcota bacterium]|nr:PPC domain-containing protein [Myxococcota bacterium]
QAHAVLPASVAITPGNAPLNDVVGAFTTPWGSARYSFEAEPGASVFIDLLDSTGENHLAWHLVDAWGREIVRQGPTMRDIERVELIGGTYFIDVWSTTAELGDYQIRVWLTSDESATLALDTAKRSQLTPPGQTETYTLAVPEGERLYLDHLYSSYTYGQGWQLVDPFGQIVHDDAQRLSEYGPFTAFGGAYTLTVSATDDNTETYELRVNTVHDDEGTIHIGDRVDGNIARPGDVDTWHFTAAPGQKVVVDLLTPFTYAIDWSLRDRFGQAVESEDATRDGLPLVLEGGEYTLRVDGENDGTGIYALQILDVQDQTGALTLGTSVTVDLSVIGTTSRYTFSAAPGQRVAFENQSSPSIYNYDVQIVDARGRVVVDTGGRLDYDGVHTLEGGDYTLVLTPHRGVTGRYVFALNPIPDVVPAPLTPGVPVSISLTNPGDGAAWSFTLASAAEIEVQALNSPALYAMQWTAIDAAGTRRCNTGSVPASWRCKLPAGAYTLALEERSGGFLSQLTFVMNVLGAPPPITTGTAATLGTTYLANASSGALQRWTYDLSGRAAPTRVFFDLTRGLTRLTWSIDDGAGQPLFKDASAQSATSNDLGPIDLRPGVYTVEVNATAASGDFSFRALEVVDDAVRAITLNQDVTGDIDSPGEADTFELVLTEPHRVFFDVADGLSYLRGWLYDDVGEPVFADAWVEANSHSIGPWPLGPGRYRLVLDTNGHYTGSYGFRLWDVADEAGAMTCGSTHAFVLGEAGEVRTFTFNASEGQRAYLDLTTGGSWARADLIDPAGVVRAGYDDAWLESATSHDLGPYVLSAGTWTVRVDPLYNYRPSLAWRWVCPTDTSRVIPLDQEVTHQMTTPGERADFWFTIDEPSTVFFDTIRGSSYLYWDLTDPNGRLLLSAFNSYSGTTDGGRKILGPGDYRLRAWTRDGSTPLFSFAVWHVEDVDRIIHIGDTVTEATTRPGSTLSYDFLVPPGGAHVYFDLLQGDSDLDWWLDDPQGQRVFLDTYADNAAQDDQGTWPLREGWHTLYVDPVGDHVPVVSFHLYTGDPARPDLHYTRWASTGVDVKRTTWEEDAGGFHVGLRYPIGDAGGAGGLLFAPDGDLVVAEYNGDALRKIDPRTGQVITMLSDATGLYRAVLDPSGTRAWATGIQGSLVEFPLAPFGPGVRRAVTGDDTALTHLAFGKDGRAFYVQGARDQTGWLGSINLASRTTTRMVFLRGAYSLAWDPYSEALVAFGNDTVTQVDPDTGAILSERSLPTGIMREGAVDGEGRAFIIDDNGDLWMLDYRATGRVGSPTSIADHDYLDPYIWGVGPMSWLGSGCTGEPLLAVTAPGDHTTWAIGGNVLITGVVEAHDPTRPVTVTLDGVPVDSTDASGRFFAVRSVASGEQVLQVQATDRCGTRTLPVTVI